MPGKRKKERNRCQGIMLKKDDNDEEKDRWL
jgi:hypothetical protein